MFPCTCQLHNCKIKSPTIHEYNKTEFVSSKFQAFSSYNLICGENCVLCRLSATVCFLSGMIALFMGNSLNFSTVLSFIFFLFLFLIKKKKCASLVAFLHKQESTNINLSWKEKYKFTLSKTFFIKLKSDTHCVYPIFKLI